MAETHWNGTEFFHGGPPRRIEQFCRLIKPDNPQTGRRAIFVALLVWAPLVLLAAAESLLLAQDKVSALLVDFGTHARYLVATPILILAEAFVLPKLGETVRHFTRAGVIRDSDRDRFNTLVVKIRKIFDSLTVEIVIVVFAYAVVMILTYTVPSEEMPVWHGLTDDHPHLSWAGWWHTLVSVPLSLVVLFSWLWRLSLWAFFLWRVSRFDLHLIPAHPDLAGGLQFVGASLRTFPLLSFAFGTVVAGGVANHVVHKGMHLLDFKYIIIALVVVILGLLVGPLFVFTRELLRARRRGIFEYGALASAVGHQLERKWLERVDTVDGSALDVQHFSATTDLYQLVSNVYQSKSVPLDLQDLIAVVVAVALPFLPVLLFEIPFNVILPDLIKLLF